MIAPEAHRIFANGHEETVFLFAAGTKLSDVPTDFHGISLHQFLVIEWRRGVEEARKRKLVYASKEEFEARYHVSVSAATKALIQKEQL